MSVSNRTSHLLSLFIVLLLALVSAQQSETKEKNSDISALVARAEKSYKELRAIEDRVDQMRTSGADTPTRQKEYTSSVLRAFFHLNELVKDIDRMWTSPEGRETRNQMVMVMESMHATIDTLPFARQVAEAMRRELYRLRRSNAA